MPIILDTDLTTAVDITRAKNIAVYKIDKLIWHPQDSNSDVSASSTAPIRPTRYAMQKVLMNPDIEYLP
jgi:hypothetical protein